MKVLQPGYTPDVPAEWWRALVFTCTYCRCVFQPDADDFARITETERDLAAFAACPNCGVLIVARRPSVDELRRLPRFAGVAGTRGAGR